MGFLAPMFLFGLLAAAIPVAIHLIRKEKPPKVVFSSLRFLKNTSKKLVLFQQIQQWLLLLLRAAVICLLVFAFARPLFDGSIAGLVDAEPESAVILLDGSMSMRYDDRFEQTREQALEIVANMTPGDEVAVISFADGTQGVRELSTDLEGARTFIENLDEPGFGTTRYMPALRLANDMLESSQHELRTIHLVSDYQASGMGGDDSGWLLSPGVNLITVDVGDDGTRNLLLTDVRSPDQLIENRSDYEILARVRSSGSVHVDTAEVRLVLNGEEQGRVQVDLTDTSEEVVRLPVVFPESGAYRGEISVGADDFAVDNTYYFTVDVMPRISVLLVNGEPSQNWYEDEAHWLSLAIGGAADSPFQVIQAQPRELDESLLEAHDVVVLLNAGSDLDTTQADALTEFVEGGGSLLLAPADNVDAAQFNRQLSALSPATLNESVLLGGADYQSIADMDRRHPILLPLGTDWGVRFQGFWSVAAGEQSSVLMEFDNGLPALVERPLGRGNVLLFTSSLDTEWNNLPLSGLYLPFIHESLRYLAQTSMKERAYRVGDVIDLSSAAADEDALEVNVPSGETFDFAPGERSFTPREIGFMSVEGDGVTQYYAVNADPEESSLERIAPSALQDRIANPETSPMQSERVRTAELAAQLEGPQRVWWWILILVLLILLTETRVANTTYR